ncbi:transcription antitermination factor NusB [bacterium]|nr:transcription antitermination factor NusB [bacterium]
MKIETKKGARTRARIAAVEILYRTDLMNEEFSIITQEVVNRRKLRGKAVQYLKSLVSMICNNMTAIDSALSRSLTDWRFDRLSYVDRAILRIAACEILFISEIPPKVSIDEAVELARFYGTDGSARFVNGVLDSLYKREVTI